MKLHITGYRASSALEASGKTEKEAIEALLHEIGREAERVQTRLRTLDKPREIPLAEAQPC